MNAVYDKLKAYLQHSSAEEIAQMIVEISKDNPMLADKLVKQLKEKRDSERK